tara:strand:- start:215 stop:409 length:195 start_codon:yes stop_codon:yes gene_type:complete
VILAFAGVDRRRPEGKGVSPLDSPLYLNAQHNSTAEQVKVIGAKGASLRLFAPAASSVMHLTFT